jgi:hypothetical protein
MEFTDRLLQVMSHYGYNKNSFSVAIGASNNTVIGRLVNERDRRPSFDLMELILKRFPELNPSWLIIGEGEMFLNRPYYIPNPKDRIIRACEAVNVNAFKLAEMTGLPKQDVVSVWNGITEPSREMLDKISEALPLINTNWLIYNEGDMFVDGVSKDKFISYFEEVPAGSTIEDIKHLSASFTMYTSRFAGKEDIHKFFAVRNQSNDFAPYLQSGDYMTIRCVEVDDVIPSDLVFVSTKRRNYIRRVANTKGNDQDIITLVDNTGLTYDIKKDEITLIGLIHTILRIVV